MTGGSRRHHGMTLVEVLVAMTVLSLVSVLLGSTLRGLGDTASRVDKRLDAADETRVAVAFLRELMGRVSTASIRALGAAPGQGRLFDAAVDHVSWVSVMPARFGAVGRYAFRLALEPVPDQAAALVLRFAPLDDAAWRFPDWGQAQARVLAREVREFRVGYGGEGLSQGWLPQWSRADSLPAHLRLDILSDAGPWPPIVLPLRTLVPPKPIFTLGGDS